MAVVLPAKKKIKHHFKQVSLAIKKNTKALEVIRKVNPILRGWRNYYKFSDSRTYGQLPGQWDSRVNVKLRHWIKRQKNQYGRPAGFWTSHGGDNWIFYAEDTKKKKRITMDKYSKTHWSLQSYNRIESQRTPYDGDLEYWSQHSGYRIMGSSSPKREFLFKQQKGRCSICGKPFTPDDLLHIEIDHIKPRAKEGSEKWTNSRLLHKECHSKRNAKTD